MSFAPEVALVFGGSLSLLAMSHHVCALALAAAQVAAVRDDPAARLALMARVFRGPTGRAPRHLPFWRAALSFMRGQARRGVLNPLEASPPGSVWWRAVNERLLRDGCETVALLGGLAGEPSSQAVRLWLEFGARPTGRNWYRAHNTSIVAGYLEHRNLAEAESAPERFFMNVALLRVLYAHALAAAPRLALGRLADEAVLAHPHERLDDLFEWSVGHSRRVQVEEVDVVQAEPARAHVRRVAEIVRIPDGAQVGVLGAAADEPALGGDDQLFWIRV
jgi:hypothetical protein